MSHNYGHDVEAADNQRVSRERSVRK